MFSVDVPSSLVYVVDLVQGRDDNMLGVVASSGTTCGMFFIASHKKCTIGGVERFFVPASHSRDNPHGNAFHQCQLAPIALRVERGMNRVVFLGRSL